MNPWPEFLALFLVIVAIIALWWRFLKGKKTKQWIEKLALFLATTATIVTLLSGYYTYWSFWNYTTDYDAKTEGMALSLQKKITKHLQSLNHKIDQKQLCQRDKFQTFYDGVILDITQLEFRTFAFPNNELTIIYVQALSKSFINLSNIHKLISNEEKEGCMSQETIFRSYDALNTLLLGITSHEIGKKPKSLGLFIKHTHLILKPFLAPLRTFFNSCSSYFSKIHGTY